MTQEQRAEFDALIADADLNLWLSKTEWAKIHLAMKAAYNLAVDKCAETAEVTHYLKGTLHIWDVDRESILKNKIV